MSAIAFSQSAGQLQCKQRVASACGRRARFSSQPVSVMVRIAAIATGVIVVATLAPQQAFAQGLLQRIENRVIQLTQPPVQQPITDPSQANPTLGNRTTLGTSNAIQALAQPTSPEPGYLGVVADDRQTFGRGVEILEVEPNSPAAQAGLKAKDLVVAIGGRPVRSMTDMGSALQASRAGALLAFDVQRDNRKQRLTIALGQRPPVDQRKFAQFGQIPSTVPNGSNAVTSRVVDSGDSGPPKLGVQMGTVDEAIRKRLALPSTLGALVTGIIPGSAAEAAGIKADDVIVAVDSLVTNRPTDLANAVAQFLPGDQVQVSLYRGGRFQRIPVQLGSSAVIDLSSGTALSSSTDLSDRPAWPAAQTFNSPASGSTTAARPSMAVPPPPRPAFSGSAGGEQFDQQARINQLEGMVQRLQQRVRDLEDQLAEHDGSSSPANSPDDASGQPADQPPAQPADAPPFAFPTPTDDTPVDSKPVDSKAADTKPTAPVAPPKPVPAPAAAPAKPKEGETKEGETTELVGPKFAPVDESFP